VNINGELNSVNNVSNNRNRNIDMSEV